MIKILLNSSKEVIRDIQFFLHTHHIQVSSDTSALCVDQKLHITVKDPIPLRSLVKKMPSILTSGELPDTLPKSEKKYITLWADVWHTRTLPVKNRLLALLHKNHVIDARCTHLVSLQKSYAHEFIATHHVLAPTRADQYLGLVYKNTLLAVASFGKPRYMKYETRPYVSVELIRFCTHYGYSLAGGLNKILDNFVRKHQVEGITTYADLEWSQGSVYEKLGFERVAQTEKLWFGLHKKDWQRQRLLHTDFAKYENEYDYVVHNLGNAKYIKKYRSDQA